MLIKSDNKKIQMSSLFSCLQIDALSLESLKASADEYREHFSRALGRAIQGTIKVRWLAAAKLLFFAVKLVSSLSMAVPREA